MEPNETAATKKMPATVKLKKNKINRKNRRKRRHQNKTSTNLLNTAYTSRTSHEIWRKTYENMIRWQSEHQVNYWRNQAINFRTVNTDLWNRLQKYEGKNNNTDEDSAQLSNEIQPEYETSSEEDEEDYDDVESNMEIDEEYLKFLEITHQHRTNLKVTREMADLSTDDDEDDIKKADDDGLN